MPMRHRELTDAESRRRVPAGRLVENLGQRLILASTALSWAVVGAGVLLRVARFLDNRSLWLDEAWIAINITEKSWDELLRPLDFLQAAPIGFLFAQKSAITLFGSTEYALRVVPLLSAIAAVFLFRYVAERLLSPAVALFALVLFAFNPFLLYQASEAKPYSSDLAVGLLLLALGIRAAAKDVSPRSLLPLALVAPLAIWLSFPAIIVLSAVFGGLMLYTLNGGRKGIVPLTGLAVIWVVLFAGVVAVTSANVSDARASIFGNGDASRVRRSADVVHEMWASFVNPGGFQNGTNGLAVLVFIVGVLVLACRRRLAPLALLGLPIALSGLAALMGRYPLGGRFSLFLVPFIVMLIAIGAFEVISKSRLPGVATVLVTAFLAGPMVVGAAADATSPPERDEIKPLLNVLVRDWRAGDSIYVSRNAQYPLRYYARCAECDPPADVYPFPARLAASPPGQFAPALDSVLPVVVVARQETTPMRIISSARPLFDRTRVWLLFVHVDTTEELFEERLITAEFGSRGRLRERVREPGASLYLYESRGP